jgi:hypothetical protein
MSDSEELVLYTRSGDPLCKIRLHRFAIRPEILARGHQLFIWDEARQHYREASELRTAPRRFNADNGAMKHLPIYDRGGQPVGRIPAPPGADPPDILYCGLWQFVWKRELGRYDEALIVRVAD